MNEAIRVCTDETEKESLFSLQNDLNELINLTNTSLETVTNEKKPNSEGTKDPIDEEYALFMVIT